MPQNILIIGATGVIGKPITKQILVAKDSFGRIAILTSPKTVEGKSEEIGLLKNNGADILTGSLDDEKDVKTAYEGIDTVVSCVGRGAIDKQIPLFKWAIEAGVTRFFASEYGTDIEYGPESKNEVPHQQKLKVRAYIRQRQQEGAKLEHTFLVTGPYSDLFIGPMKFKPEAGSFNVPDRKAVLVGMGKEKVSLTAMADVGKLLVGALRHADASKNATLIVNSFTTTGQEILEEFEKQTGSKWDVSYTSLDELKAIEKKAYAEKLPYAVGITLRRIWTEGGTLYDYRDNGKLGDPQMETLAEQVKQNIAKQTAE